MATGTQQEFQAQNKANKPAVQDKDFFADMFGDNDFAQFDEESGEIQLNAIEQPQQSETSNVDESVADSPVSETQTTEDSGKSPNAYEQRIQSLESSLNQVLEVLATKIVPALNGKQSQEQLIEEEDFDFTDTSSLKKLISNQIEQTLSKVLGPLQQSSQKFQKYDEANNAFLKYGQDFTEKIPVIGELMKVDANLSFENAYLLAKNLEKHYQKAPATSHGNTQTTTPVVTKSAAALIEKAEKLQTVNGVTPAGQQRPVAKDIRAAFEQALAELDAGSL